MKDTGRARLAKAAKNEARRLEDEAKLDWQRWAKCPFCGKKVCVNNYADHKIRVPKLDGVAMCPFCQHSGGKFIAAAFKLLRKAAEHENETYGEVEQDLIDVFYTMATPPKWLGDFIEKEIE